MTKEEDIAIDDEYLDIELKSLLDSTQEGKKLFYRFCKKWHGFLDSSRGRRVDFAETDSGSMQL